MHNPRINTKRIIHKSFKHILLTSFTELNLYAYFQGHLRFIFIIFRFKRDLYLRVLTPLYNEISKKNI